MGEPVTLVSAAVSVTVARIRSLVGAITWLYSSISWTGKDVNVRRDGDQHDGGMDQIGGPLISSVDPR